ncbi:TldD/PmbA family protein [Bacteroidetes/Chlorobi group bacterium ChocPot_Mid]|nr:MAG: TldD/PmbA family protein [Bacteroidetes/Chlorobi group bacterium ChocPot_Mid]
MRSENLRNLAEKFVEKAKKLGASECQVSIGSDTNFEVQILNQEIEKLNQAGSKSVSFKVIVDSKVAYASSSDFNEGTLERLMQNAIARAKLTSADQFSGLPELEKVTVDVDSLGLFDRRIIELEAERKIDFAKKLEQIGLSNKQIKVSVGSSYSTNYGETVIANTNGFSGSYQYTYCSAGAGFQSGDGNNLVEDYWYETSLNLDGMKSAEEIANMAVTRVIRMIGGQKVKSQVVPVVFEPTMTSTLLGFLASCVNGNSIYMKRSFLAGKLGEQIAGANINIIDDGLMPGKLGTKPFDSEGVPTRRTPIVENGVLKNYLLNTYSAKKLKLKSTGNAGGANNFYLEQGKYSQEEIIKSVKNGLLLTRTIGQGTMPTTGDISKGAYGMWIENGELTIPVSEITFSGNLGDMLKNISMIGNDNDFRRSVSGPTIKIENVSLSGS